MNESNRREFIREILRIAPAGQFNELLENLQELGKLDDDELHDVKEQYDNQICARSTSTPTHALAESLERQVEAYQNGYDAANGVTARREIAQGANADQLLLRTYAERIDTEKCRTGCWTGEWTIHSDSGSPSAAKISGQVEMLVFSYEDGNIQIRSNKDFSEMHLVEESDSAGLAEVIVKQIAVWENEVIESLRESYTHVNKNLKAIRGILPITHTRLNWNVVAQRTVRTLQETVNK